MPKHVYTQRADTTRYHVEFSPSTLYGWFEHHTLGDQRGGGLWFEKRDMLSFGLTDYDGVSELPRQVIDQLVEWGIEVDPEFYPDTPSASPRLNVGGGCL